MGEVKGFATRHELHFGDRVVRCFEQRPLSVGQMLAEAVTQGPDGEALVCGDTRLQWRQLHEQVLRCASGLAGLGVAPGDRVALLLGNGSEFVIATLATSVLGAVVVPLSTREQTPGLQYMLNHCEAAVVICDAELDERLPESAEMPFVRHRVVVPQRAGRIAFADLLRAEPLQAAAEVQEEDPVAILYTSGTTGRPKGAVLTHLGVVHSAMHYQQAMGLTSSDRAAAVVPLGHVTGLVAMIMTMVRCAGTLVVAPTFRAADFLALAARERISYTLMVPAMYNLCLLQPDLNRHDLSAWRIGGYGGAPMPQATIDAVARQWPRLGLMNVYGATETTSPATIMPPRETGRRGESVGVSVPCADVVVMDDSGCEVPRGEPGEIWMAGPMVVRGYWNNKDATRDNIIGGYWRSGDIGWMDTDGFVHVSDRKKDMLNRGGLKIYSVEVEGVLARCPGVIEAAVVGKPCPVLGERVHAFVYAGDSKVDEAALLAVCSEALSDYKVPETITVLGEPLPRNANGKVLKRELRARLLEERAGQEETAQ